MSKDLVEKKQAELSTDVDNLDDWGSPPISSQDVVIPMVLLMQFTSDKVKAQTAKFGEFRDNLNDDLLGDQQEAFEFIPFHAEKLWIEYDASAGTGFGQKKFIGSVPITAANDNLPYEDLEADTPTVRDRAIYIYGLIADKYDSSIPVVIPFRRTSLKAGKSILTQMYVQNRAAKKNPASYTICLTSKKETGDSGDYAVAIAKVGRETTKEEQTKALEWLKTVKSGAAKVSEEALKEDYNPEDFVSEEY